jgi:uncharacterized membrane protein YdbT with pleckstrin-like domain
MPQPVATMPDESKTARKLEAEKRRAKGLGGRTLPDSFGTSELNPEQQLAAQRTLESGTGESAEPEVSQPEGETEQNQTRAEEAGKNEEEVRKKKKEEEKEQQFNQQASQASDFETKLNQLRGVARKVAADKVKQVVAQAAKTAARAAGQAILAAVRVTIVFIAETLGASFIAFWWVWLIVLGVLIIIMFIKWCTDNTTQCSQTFGLQGVQFIFEYFKIKFTGG